jgi:putative ABC transport system permease protein
MNLHRQPWVAALIIFSLALMIGAATAIFRLADRIFWVPLAFPSAERLVVLSDVVRRNDLDLVRTLSGSRSFLSAAVFDLGPAEFQIAQEAGRLRAAEASTSILEVLGVQAAFGRGFEESDERAGSERVALLSERFWSQRFARSPDLIGHVMLLRSSPYRIIGIAPPEVELLGGFDVLMARNRAVPGAVVGGASTANEIRVDGIIARLRSSVTMDQAASEVSVLAGPGSERPNAQRGRVQRLRAVLSPQDTSLARGALVSIAGLLAFGCAKVCLMYLAWLQSRRRELATKLALGVAPSTLARQCLTEAFFIVGLAGPLGLLLSQWSATLIVAGLPGVSHLLQDWRLEWRAVAFAGSAALLTMSAIAALGMATLAHFRAADLVSVLTGSGMGIRASRRGVRIQRGLMTFGFALSVGLLGSASVVTSAFLAQIREDLGFRVDALVTFEVWKPALSLPAYTGAGVPPREWRARVAAERTEHETRFYARLLEELSRIPGVTHAGAGSTLPPAAVGRSNQYVHTGNPRHGAIARISAVSGSYFEALGIEALQGTTLARPAGVGGASAVIDELMAAQLWPDQPAIGRTLWLAQEPTPRQVVGVVPSIKSVDGLSRTRGHVYIPNVHPLPLPGDLAIAVRSPRPMTELAPQIAAAIRTVDPGGSSTASGADTSSLTRWWRPPGHVACCSF